MRAFLTIGLDEQSLFPFIFTRRAEVETYIAGGKPSLFLGYDAAIGKADGGIRHSAGFKGIYRADIKAHGTAMANRVFYVRLSRSNKRFKRSSCLDSHEAQVWAIYRVKDHGALASLAQSGTDGGFLQVKLSFAGIAILAYRLSRVSLTLNKIYQRFQSGGNMLGKTTQLKDTIFSSELIKVAFRA